MAIFFSTPLMSTALHTLTDKERATLRLIVRGHDAKTAARELTVSVHTINERLRAARRKLNVTSSREAARLLLESEAHKNLGYEQIGDVTATKTSDTHRTTRKDRSLAFWIGGVCTMLIATTVAALLLSANTPLDREIGEAATPIEVSMLTTLETRSRTWLTLVDASDWEASFQETGQSFQKLNTIKGWADASRQARVPLGAVARRKTLTAEFVAAPPKGYAIVHFKTRFESGTEARESVTLEEENGVWKVVGYVIN